MGYSGARLAPINLEARKLRPEAEAAPASVWACAGGKRLRSGRFIDLNLAHHLGLA